MTRRCVSPLPMGMVLAAGPASSAARFTPSIGRRRRAGAAEPGGCVRRAPRRSARRSRATCSAHFGRLLHRIPAEVPHDEPRADAPRASNSRGGPRQGRARARQGRAALHRALRLLGDQRARPRPLVLQPRGSCSRDRWTIRCSTILERVRARTGNSVRYRRGAVRRISERSARTRAIPVLIDQRHPRPTPSTWISSIVPLRRHRPSPPWRCGPARRRSGLRAAAGRALPAWSTNTPSIRRGRRSRRPPRLHSAPDVLDCTSAGIRACGCGCTAAGVVEPANDEGRGTCFRRRRGKRRASDGRRPRHLCDERGCPRGLSVGEVQRLLVRAPNLLGDAVMALPALEAVRRGFAGRTVILAGLSSRIVPESSRRDGGRAQRDPVDRSREPSGPTESRAGRRRAAPDELGSAGAPGGPAEAARRSAGLPRGRPRLAAHARCRASPARAPGPVGVELGPRSRNRCGGRLRPEAPNSRATRP